MSPWKLWKQMFDAWEGATADYVEQVIRSPVVLEPGGAWLTTMMKLKASSDQMMAGFWGAIGLPTKRDQERTLHLLNQLHSRVLDLEERLEDAQRREDARAEAERRGSRGTAALD